MGWHERLWVVLAIAACLGLSGCSATTVVPPSAVAQPVRIAILDHGRHSSLLLEEPDGTILRYAYGEWDWYALGKTGPARALGALFWPSEAALGRKRLAGPLSPETVRQQIREGVEDIVILEVEAERAARLAQRLDALFQAGQARSIYHPGFDLEFVPIPTSYWLGRSSNLVTAEWLEELGVRVDNPGILSVWRREAG